MHIKAIVASLVLGSSSLAMAAPAVTTTPGGIYGTKIAVDHHLPPVYRPVTLASGLRFGAHGRAAITVGSQAGRFGALKISTTSGHTFVRQVYVQFANGQDQVIRNVNRGLNGRDSLTLDLDGDRRAIRRIVVYGTDPYGRGAAFTVAGA